MLLPMILDLLFTNDTFKQTHFHILNVKLQNKNSRVKPLDSFEVVKQQSSLSCIVSLCLTGSV